MNDFKKSAMIALLPIQTNWCRIELPHLTLVYAGEIDQLQPTAFNSLAKDASSLASLSKPITLRTKGTAIFGDEEKVEVITLELTSELAAMRQVVEGWNVSQYPFRPHVTVGPAGEPSTEIPRFIAFDRILVAWGEDHIVFNMPY